MSLEEVPYNTSNVVLGTNDLNNLLSKFQVDKFYDINYYRRAFIHKSYITRKNENFQTGNVNCPRDCMPLQEQSNERLEFLGDSVLSTVVASYCFHRYPDMNEGFLTNMRTKLVNGKMLANLADKLNLQNLIVLSKQIDENNGRENKNILEDTFEAFIGAIYLDHNEKNDNGFVVAERWILNVIENFVDFSELIHKTENYKDVFIKYCHHTFQWKPKFFEINITEQNGKKIHTVCIKNDRNDVIATGKNINRKAAEIDASKSALHFYGYFANKS